MRRLIKFIVATFCMLKAINAWILQYSVAPISRTYFSGRSPSCLHATSSASIDSATQTGQEHPDPIPANAFTALDLATFLIHLKSYACTKRGEQSILSLIPLSTSSLKEHRREGQKQSLFGSNRQLQRKQRYAAAGSRSSTRSTKVNGHHHHVLPIAKSAEDCVHEYKLVQEAMGLLNSHNNSSTGKDVILPPIFKLSDGDTGSDEDDWVEACMSSQLDIYQEIDLETILQAECLVKLLLDTHDWAKESPYSGLAGVVGEMDGCAKHLSKLYYTLEGAVEIVRPKGTSNDSFYYMFQLASGNGRYPELDALHEREVNSLQKMKGNKIADCDMNNHRQLATLREEISILEKQTTNKLIASMIDASPHVERALDVLARLDVIFARALFALDYNGVIPEVGDESNIIVKNFVHPVLALEKSISGVVPIDLLLPGPVLVISGPNAGGKTLALKSFGLAACFVKLGIPITVNWIPSEESEVRVDFFENIFVQIGDSQDLLLGESTLMARLNSCSKLIQRLEITETGGTLALLDELGGGTDPYAGAALSQAILEKLIEKRNSFSTESHNAMCKVVATTHSPQLKSLALDDNRFQSASVLLESQEGGEIEQNTLTSIKTKPTFKLNYGFATESFPLGAAARCSPSLPDDVMRRAAELMSKGSDGDDTVEALRRHMVALEKERSSARKHVDDAKELFHEVAEYKTNMIGKLQSSDSHLSRLEARLQNIYETLSNDKTKSTYELVGDSLSTLRLLRKAVKSEEEVLKEKGLRRVSDMHSFYDNESVVIIAEGEWQWQNAVVRINESSDSIDQETIAVVPTLDMTLDIDDTSQALLVNRRDIAVWDIPEWGFDDEDQYSSSSYPRRHKSSSKVLDILKQVGETTPTRARTIQTSSKTPSFTSARERKASTKKSATKKKKGKKK